MRGTPSSASSSRRADLWANLWPDRRTVWRWHVLSGLFCLPFVAFLCLTGAVYLFKPQIDRLIDRPYDHLAVASSIATPAQEVRAALASIPNGRLLALELPQGPGHAARVLVDRGGEAIRVYVDPASLKIVKTVPEEQRFERIVLKLHGQLLLGNAGSMVMEMVASWTIVLILTGLFLWWPRPLRGGGVVVPRLKTVARWRDLHAVTGFWVSALLALFLVSGLPWSFVWGQALAQLQHRLSQAQSLQDWEIGAQPARTAIAGHPVIEPPRMAAAMPGMEMDAPPPAAAEALAGLDAVVATAHRLDFPLPVMIVPPAPGAQLWHVRSDTQDRPRRIEALVRPDGAVSSIKRFGAKPFVDRAVGYGVAAHEGHLFGWANQLLNLLVAALLLVMSLAATVLWLRRRPPGTLGVPERVPEPRVGIGTVLAMLVLGVLLPELGASLLLLAAGAFVLNRVRA
ncbi:PepSY domain-containing protein [Acetobacteraceae bacterium KSS8]|uniref:PepSY domain-containing protein n=1 Tax=Endosaccharibacter trunci TaxID=2812733 RepID=A0ABT1W7M8_9PROT|nr:PepSY domain-containing protein [Acetobacteraceae bacterium KSS8]